MVYTAPGVYVVEDDRTPMPLTGVPTGIPCFVGFTDQGPYLTPTRIGSLTEFNAVFGPRLRNSVVFPHAVLADAVYGFFLNGGSVAYILRVNGGQTVTWPVAAIEHVVDYADLTDPYSDATPQTPKWLSLNVSASSPGSWANPLVLKCRPDTSGDPLPLISAKIQIDPKLLAAAPTLVTVDQLEAAGSIALPGGDLTGWQLTLGDDSANQGAFDAGKKGFAVPKIPTASSVGTLVKTSKPDKPIAVRFTPDSSIPATAVGLVSEDGKTVTAITAAQAAGWAASTNISLPGVSLAGKPTDLTGNWALDATGAPRFYITTDAGAAVVLNQATLTTAVPGTLTYPLNLNPGDGLTFTLEIKELVPPRQPGSPASYRVLESYSGLSSVPGTANYFLNDGLINGVSSRIRVAAFDGSKGKAVVFAAASTDPKVTLVTPPADGAKVENAGTDQAPAPTEYLRYFPLLKQVDDVSLVTCPDVYVQGATTPAFTYQPILQAMIDYCENNRTMAVIDAPPQAPVQEIGDLAVRVGNIEKFVAAYRSSYAAVYAPWLVVPNNDPRDPSKTKQIPPSGHLLGIYNQSDNAEGVWSAPANIAVKGPVGLALPFTEDDSAVLNPKGVNLIRSFAGQGILVWGARTTSGNVMWQYVNVRRLFLYVERTLKQQTQWAVFEPNTKRTWNTLINAAENFLRQIWLDGGLAGSSPEQAFRVQCGVPETMTQTDVDTGLLKVQIAIAPVKPAEFIVFTVSQLVQTAS